MSDSFTTSDSILPVSVGQISPVVGNVSLSKLRIGTNKTTTRGRMGRVAGVRIASTGSYVPERVVTNEDLHELGCDSEWIVRRTGIRQRRRAAADQATSDLAYIAAIRCLKRAGVSADQVDLIVVATVTPDHTFPSTACHLQRRLGCLAPAMDVNASCAGFMYGLVTASQFIAAKNSKCALVVGADIMTSTVNPGDQKTFPLFGDGAGAVLLTPDQGSGEILSYQMGSEGCGGEMLCKPAGGTRMELTPEAYRQGKQYVMMDGRSVFKWAVRVVIDSAEQVLDHADRQADQLSLCILHQANQRIIDSAISSLKIPADKVFVNLDRYGNTSGASIPLAIDEANQAGMIKRGDLVLLSGFGAGLCWGTALMRW